MKYPDTIDYWLCDDCAIAEVNGDYTGMDDERADEVQKCLEETGQLNYDGEENEFSNMPCDCCNGLPGRRTLFVMVRR